MITQTSIVNEVSATTHMTNEAVVKQVGRAHLTSVPQGLHQTSDIGFRQDAIKDFLSKPTRLTHFEWNATQAANNTLFSAVLPTNLTGDTIYGHKLKGYLGIRATVRVRVQVNGQKFQAGRLLCSFYPQGGMTGSYTTYRRRSLRSATQLPRVELDLSTETEVVMDIPYISPAPYLNLLGSNVEEVVPFGSFAVQVYSPLKTGTGSTTAQVTVWTSYHDVELVGASAQMSDRRPKGYKGDSQMAELEVSGGKPLSSGFAKLASAAASFAKIPMLSSVATPASWVLEAISGSIRAFGYSKPSEQGAMTRVMDQVNVHMPNADGVDPFPNLSISAQNSLGILPGFAGTDVDEMTISHIAQIPAYGTSINVPTEYAAGTILSQLHVHPFTFCNDAVFGSQTGYDMTPLGYIASNFAMWRGSITLTLKLVKTQFHSGRLLVCFSPKNTPASMDDTSYILREIIDVRDSNEFRFSIPYMTLEQFYPLSQTDFSDSYGYTGFVTIYVLNSIVAPDTVAQSIDVLVEWSGGPDIEFAQPSNRNFASCVPAIFDSQMSDRPANDVGPSSRTDRNEDLSGMGNSSVPTVYIEPSQYCAGEKINSILQLMKRYSCIMPTDLMMTDSAYIDIRPYVICAATASPSDEGYQLMGDYYARFASMYRYGRGCLRVMAVNKRSDSLNHFGAIYTYPRALGSSSFIFFGNDFFPTTGSAVSLQPEKTYMGATVPAYQRQQCRLHRFTVSGGADEPLDANTTSVAVRFQKNTTTADDQSPSYIFRAAADDFAFGYFIGTPFVKLY